MTGTSTVFLGVSAAAVGLGVGASFSRLSEVDTRRLGAVGVAVSSVSAAVYLTTLPPGVFSLNHLVSDAVGFATGSMSVMRILNAGVWSVFFVPIPLFVSVYLVLTTRYVGATGVAGAVLGFFVLTGDADSTLVLLGVAGGIAAVGFGEIDRLAEDQRPPKSAYTTVLLTLLVVAASPLVVTAVPGDETGILGGDGGGEGGSGGSEVSTGFAKASDTYDISEGVDLTTRRIYTVESERVPEYMVVSVYDRYSGESWVRTQSASASTRAQPPPEVRDFVTQRVNLNSSGLGIRPSVYKPVDVEGGPTISPDGYLEASETPETSETDTDTSYRVISGVAPENRRVVEALSSSSSSSSSEYPPEIRERYLQTPETVPERLVEKTSEITRGDPTAYAKAESVEDWLETNKEYSLQVERPNSTRGGVADSFVFGMEEGYCVYYATSMTVMLRTQGVPARYVTGYLPGDSVGENTWRQRGVDSHAWVQVYFPDVGWVDFDPTPSAPRETQEALMVPGRTPPPSTDIPSPNGTQTDSRTPTNQTNTTDSSDQTTNTSTSTSSENTTVRAGYSNSESDASLVSAVSSTIPVSLSEALSLGVSAVVLHLTGVFGDVAKRLRLRLQITSTRSHEARSRTVSTARRRAEAAISRRHGRRRRGETFRDYVERTLGEGELSGLIEAHERSAYSDGVSASDVKAAVDDADSTVRQTKRLGFAVSLRSPLDYIRDKLQVSQL
ncbi:MAG: transglutaminase-like domain-containing protein [Halobacteria archaeon]|nr:transglutaminase-like domain-containing protein [Halobacteria archaeon]